MLGKRSLIEKSQLGVPETRNIVSDTFVKRSHVDKGQLGVRETHDTVGDISGCWIPQIELDKSFIQFSSQYVCGSGAQPLESLSITYQQKGAWATQPLETIVCRK